MNKQGQVLIVKVIGMHREDHITGRIGIVVTILGPNGTTIPIIGNGMKEEEEMKGSIEGEEMETETTIVSITKGRTKVLNSMATVIKGSCKLINMT
jgi:hypothetical protein